MQAKVEIVKSGITFGTALAMAISFSVNNSVTWAVIHGLLFWIYVIYFVVRFRLIGA